MKGGEEKQTRNPSRPLPFLRPFGSKRAELERKGGEEKQTNNPSPTLPREGVKSPPWGDLEGVPLTSHFSLRKALIPLDAIAIAAALVVLQRIGKG